MASEPSREAPMQGGCLCGAVRFELTGRIVSANYCHCTRCQRRTGTAASANGRVARDSFRVLQGERSIGTFAPPDGAPKNFCTQCGSALFSGSLAHDEAIGVRLGAIDDDPGVRPSYRQYVDFAAPWEPLPDDSLKRYPDARTDS